MSSEHFKETATELARIAWLSGQDPTKRFDCLMHHINVDSLVGCFHQLDGRRAMGADCISKEVYGEALLEHTYTLVERMKKMAYHPGPVREVRIPKAGKRGAFRSLGIANFEDKLVQKMMAKILESIYEPTFAKSSFGFRPSLGCHDAVRALYQHVSKRPVNTVIDVDLENFFGSIRREVVKEILCRRIGDEKFIRYVDRMLRSGVLADGELKVSDEGVPQGSPCSPIIANIVADHVIDRWFEDIVKSHCRGEVAMFRYCDDMVICCQSESDALRIRQALPKRLEKFGLKLNSDKTRMVSFSRATTAKTKPKRKSFEFLGFKFYFGRSRKGKLVPKLKTSPRRLASKLRDIATWIRTVRSRARLPEIWATFKAKIRGHIAYYGVTFNIRGIWAFTHEAILIVWKWLNRRGGKRPLTWSKFQKFMQRYPLPKLKVYHSLFC